MKKDIPYWQIGGFIFTAIVGTLLHFLFDWTGESLTAALFSAVNESIWEHMKLLFYPMMAFALWQYKAVGKGMPCFWQVKLMGILLGLILIPTLYYTYTGALGVSADWFNITIFFLTAGVVFRLETQLLLRKTACSLPNWAAVGALILIAAVFAVLTFRPPEIPLFADPVTGGYGLWYNVSNFATWA